MYSVKLIDNYCIAVLLCLICIFIYIAWARIVAGMVEMYGVVRLAAQVTLGILLAATVAKLALAEPVVCSSLRQQLAAASGKARSGAVLDGRAVQQAAITLQQSRVKARQAGCNGALFSRNKPAQCSGLERQIAKQVANIEQLKRGGNRRDSSSGERITAALKANGCVPQRKSFLEVLFGRGRESSVPQKQAAPQPEQKRLSKSSSPDGIPTTYEGVDPLTGASVKKGYRTLCVRTCDGYYFPISFSTKSKFFARDQNACNAMCPAGNAQLYYHAVPEQESEDMISVSGNTPYSELPHAFNYRTAGVDAVPGCACNSAQRTGMVTASVVSQNDPAEPAPPLELGLSSEPDKTGGTAATALLNIVNEEAIRPYDQDVRMVGPTFLPDDSDAIDFSSRPPDVPTEKKVSTRFTAETVVKTISSDILRRIRE